MRKYLLLFFLILLLFVTFSCHFPETEQATIAQPEQYTEKELQIWSGALLQNINAITETEENSKTTCFQRLLGYEGETTYYFDRQKIVSRLTFAFPPHTPWNEAANRISEQLGEPSFATLYENGNAAAEWKHSETLFALATEGKIMTLTAAKYYQNEN